jgi:hypothetical protein
VQFPATRLTGIKLERWQLVAVGAPLGSGGAAPVKIRLEGGHMLEEAKPVNEPHCDLCGDRDRGPDVLQLRARCHLTAPLQATLEDGVLTLRCYLPECGRVVARLRVFETLN